MKKSLSILLALLMILSSLPVMAFTVAAEESTEASINLMEDYTYANWQTRRWGSATEGTSHNGGNSVYFKGMLYQQAFTTVTLETDTTYTLDFDWMADADENGYGICPQSIWVFPESAYGSNEDLLAPAPSAALESYPGSGSWHHDNGDFYPAGATGTLTQSGADLESATADTTPRVNAAPGTWQHVATNFTTNSTDTEYAILFIFNFNSTGNKGANNVNMSDFMLVKRDEMASIPIEKKASGHFGYWRWNSKFNSNYTTLGGEESDFYMNFPQSQSIFTTVELNPNSIYDLSYDYYSVNVSGTIYRPTYVDAYPISDDIDVYNKTFTEYTTSATEEELAKFDTFVWYEGTLPKAVGDKAAGSSFNGYLPSLTETDHSVAGSEYYGTPVSDTWIDAGARIKTSDATKYIIIIGFGPYSGSSPSFGAEEMYFKDFALEEKLAQKPGNLLNYATHAKGDVTWTTTTDVDSRIGSVGEWGTSYQDNPEYSYNGGYAWTFGFGDGRVGGDGTYTDDMYLETYGYVYIKADGLKADKTYDFSFIYRKGFYFMIDSIKCGDYEAAYIVEPTDKMLSDASGEITSVLFTVPADGDYLITLKSNRACTTTYNTWQATYLSDLELYEHDAMYVVAIGDTVGNGSAKADKTGYVEEGDTVIFTAHAELYEKFLGWYIDDTLVSEEETYAHTVSGDVTVTANFTERSENLMKDYTADSFTCDQTFVSFSDSDSRYGGNGVFVCNVMHQTITTTVNLEADKNYIFNFEWLSADNTYNNVYPNTIKVYKTDGDGTDIETGSGYANQTLANSCTWQNVSTSFTPTESGEYTIAIHFTMEKEDSGDGQGSVHHNNGQSIYLSDFALKAEWENPEPVINWRGVRWSTISNSTDSYGDGRAYRVYDAMNQNINTTLELKPGTTYNYSFKWKAIANDSGLAYVSSSSIYSANSGSTTLPASSESDENWGAECNYKYESWGDYTPVYIPNEGYSNLMTNVSNPNNTNAAEDADLIEWNEYSATFTTIEDDEYYLFINFGLKNGANHQVVIISDVVIEEVVKGTAPECDEMVSHPGVSIRKASESSFGQALRYKFTIDGDVIANAQTDGYELVEYGTVVALADELEGHSADPILGATSYTVKAGVAYNKDNGTNIQYAIDADGNVTYTAALYNIPAENYSTECAVRPYARFRNADGDEYIRYGTTRVACIFDVAKAVLEGSNEDDQSYVNNTLLAGYIKDAYDAWLAE